MPRLTKKEKISLERKKDTLTILTIITWPFKIIYIIIAGKPEEYIPFKVIETIKGKFSNFESFLRKNPSTIGIIIGARGTGKSADFWRVQLEYGDA